jgi:hypothetical protein
MTRLVPFHRPAQSFDCAHHSVVRSALDDQACVTALSLRLAHPATNVILSGGASAARAVVEGRIDLLTFACLLAVSGPSTALTTLRFAPLWMTRRVSFHRSAQSFDCAHHSVACSALDDQACIFSSLGAVLRLRSPLCGSLRSG